MLPKRKEMNKKCVYLSKTSSPKSKVSGAKIGITFVSSVSPFSLLQKWNTRRYGSASFHGPKSPPQPSILKFIQREIKIEIHAIKFAHNSHY